METLDRCLTHLGDAYDRLATTDTSTRDAEQLPARICVKDWQHVTRQLLTDDRDHRDTIRALTRALRDAITGDADARDLNAAVEAARAHAQ